MLELYIYLWRYHIQNQSIKQTDVCEWLEISSTTYWRYMTTLKLNGLIKYRSGRYANSAKVSICNISNLKCCTENNKISNLKPYMLVYETFLRSHTTSDKQAIQFSGICAYHYGDGMNFRISDYDQSKDYEGKQGNGFSFIAKADNISELHKKIINYFQKWDKEKSPYDNFPYEVWAKKQLEYIV